MVITILSLSIWISNFGAQNINSTSDLKSIFESDYQARQLVLRNINIYPNIPLARFFQNKLVIISNKYFDNLFDFLDPNYYFFGSHPREVVNGQNYIRLPLLAILPLLFFIFKFKGKYKNIVAYSFLFAIIILSFFANHHMLDFLLWPYFFVAIYLGLIEMFKSHNKLTTLFLLLILFEIFYELRLFF
jgi:hypothetical protein